MMLNIDDISSPRLVYVCSAARCGSTLTDMFLGGHAQVASLGEVDFLGKAIRLAQLCTCGETVRNCTKWRLVFKDIRLRTGIDLLRDPYAFRLWDAKAINVVDPVYQSRLRLAAMRMRSALLEIREHVPSVLRRLSPLPPPMGLALDNKIILVDTLARLWGKNVVIDSSKNAREAVELYRRHPAKVRVILLSRDGRGVYLSRRSSGRSREDSLSGWLRYYKRAMPLLKKNVEAKNLYQLRYEDLASAPEQTGRALCNFIGIPFDPLMLDLAQGDRHMVNGNDTRFMPQKGISLDERWRNELVGDEMEYFEHHGGTLNRALGYD